MAVASDSDLSSEYSDTGIDELEAKEEPDSESDAELQRKFAEGLLAPGLHRSTSNPKPVRKFANDVNGMKIKLAEYTLDLPWIERFDIISDVAPIAPELEAEIAAHDQTKIKPFDKRKKTIKRYDVHNDFKREMNFYRQGQAAVMEAYSRLTALNLPTNRPEDYFAEMTKSDEHMQKIRRRLSRRKIGLEISERVKKIRELKKFGKKVQVEVEMQKQKEKKEMMDKIKMFRKRKTNTIDFLEDKNEPLRSKQSGPKTPFNKKQNAKRTRKDKQYGFGGRKKNMKRNTASDAWDDNLPPMKKSRGGQKLKQKGRAKYVNRNKKSSKNRGRGRR